MLKTGIFASRWWLVAGAVLGLMLNTGVVSNFAFAVFLKPITEDLHIGRATLGSALVIGSLVGTCVAPFFGRAIDYFGLRIAHMTMIFFFAVTTAMLGLLQPAYGILALLFAVHGLFGAGQSPIAYSKAVAAWFDKDRGLALGIAIAGVGLGVAVIPTSVNWVIQHYGWRWAYPALGGAILLFALLPVYLFEREPPAPPERAHDARSEALPGLTLRQSIAQWRFWAMTIAFFVTIIAVNGTLTQVVALMTDRGQPLRAAVFALSMSGIALTLGRIVSGFCLDRFHGPYVATAFFSSAAIGVALLATGLSPFWGTVLCGLGIGAEVDLMAFLVSRYFGIRHFGAVYGLMFALFSLGVGLGPWLMGLSHDYLKSYVPMMIVFEVALATAIALLLPLGPYRFASGREKVLRGLQPEAT
jgi:MFS family permease